MIHLPGPVAELCAALGAQEGVQAVTIGGSRAAGTSDETSDWDLGLYYRGHADFTMLARYGEVHSPGSWGRIMNGGAWLSLAVESAGLESRHVWFERIPASPADLVGWVGSGRAALATVQEADCRRSR